MRIFEWAIEDIVDAYPFLRLDDYAAMAVALMGPSPPCEFQVRVGGFQIAELDEDDAFILRITWTPRTLASAERIGRTKQRASMVEGAAVAIAALLFSHCVQDSTWEVTVRGDGPDYWLPRLAHALEISGTESVREMTSRRREKKLQLLANSRGWDGYVVLCCFAEPQRMIEWTYHSQREQS